MKEQGVYDVLECQSKETPLGPALRIQISRRDLKKMYWDEVYAVFRQRYPNRVALQVFPQDVHKFDNANKYHLWTFPEGALRAFDLFENT